MRFGYGKLLERFWAETNRLLYLSFTHFIWPDWVLFQLKKEEEKANISSSLSLSQVKTKIEEDLYRFYPSKHQLTVMLHPDYNFHSTI